MLITVVTSRINKMRELLEDIRSELANLSALEGAAWAETLINDVVYNDLIQFIQTHPQDLTPLYQQLYSIDARVILLDDALATCESEIDALEDRVNTMDVLDAVFDTRLKTLEAWIAAHGPGHHHGSHAH
jgi:hypothetical protein